MDKSKFLNIITFGHLNRKAKKQAQKMAEQKNSELTLNTVSLPDVQALKNALGSDANIKSVKSTISTITFELNDMNLINQDLLKQISKKGIVKSNISVTLLIGDCATELAKQFNK